MGNTHQPLNEFGRDHAALLSRHSSWLLRAARSAGAARHTEAARSTSSAQPASEAGWVARRLARTLGSPSSTATLLDGAPHSSEASLDAPVSPGNYNARGSRAPRRSEQEADRERREKGAGSSWLHTWRYVAEDDGNAPSEPFWRRFDAEPPLRTCTRTCRKSNRLASFQHSKRQAHRGSWRFAFSGKLVSINDRGQPCRSPSWHLRREDR